MLGHGQRGGGRERERETKENDALILNIKTNCYLQNPCEGNFKFINALTNHFS